MSTLSVTMSDGYTERYEALLRATNTIAACSDCDTAADALAKALHEVVPFDYLQLVAFEGDTKSVVWHLQSSNGTRQDLPLKDIVVEDTPIEWVHESRQALVTSDWREERRFSKYGEFLNQQGIASTCTLPAGERTPSARRAEQSAVRIRMPTLRRRFSSSLSSPTRLHLRSMRR